MEFDQVVLGRRSIRGYKPDPVPKELIEEILALAMRAPSSMNTQPWNFYVLTGEPLDRIRAGNTERNLAGVPHSREFRIGGAFAGVHRDRQVGVAKQLFAAMGIAREDQVMRQDWVLRGFRQFDAPVCIIITYDKVLDGSDDTPFDCGAVATALVNAAWSRGLGTVINSQGIMQSPVVREHAGIADDQVIMKSIALGWPDETFPANAVVSERKSVADATTFVGNTSVNLVFLRAPLWARRIAAFSREVFPAHALPFALRAPAGATATATAAALAGIVFRLTPAASLNGRGLELHWRTNHDQAS
eukprot:gene14279-19158_t